MGRPGFVELELAAGGAVAGGRQEQRGACAGLEQRILVVSGEGQPQGTRRQRGELLGSHKSEWYIL